MQNPFRYFNSSPEIIRLTVMMYIRYPLSLHQVTDLLFAGDIDICRQLPDRRRGSPHRVRIFRILHRRGRLGDSRWPAARRVRIVVGRSRSFHTLIRHVHTHHQHPAVFQRDDPSRQKLSACTLSGLFGQNWLIE